MTYLLDTNTCIQYLNQRDSFVRRRLAAVPSEGVRLCSIVKAEL
jgi:tRNA(fMet)-specific endonuclease VapC